jgi:hypothetical protein
MMAVIIVMLVLSLMFGLDVTLSSAMVAAVGVGGVGTVEEGGCFVSWGWKRVSYSLPLSHLYESVGDVAMHHRCC